MFRRVGAQSLTQCFGAVSAGTAVRFAAMGGRGRGLTSTPDSYGSKNDVMSADQMRAAIAADDVVPSRFPPGSPVGGIPKAGEANKPPPPPTKPAEEPKFFSYSISDKGVCTLAMNRAPVNSLSLEMFQEINNWLVWFGYDDNVKSVILTSSLATVFSAGLDINELYNPDKERFPLFWTNFQEIWMILNTFPKPVVAAINGNAPAGGCMLALCADLRVMAKCPANKPERPYRIGLNETKLGIVAPPWLMGSYSYVLGQRKAERMLQLGETPTAEEALALGLVDKCVDEEQVMTVANQEVERLMSVPNEARWMSKDLMRQELFGHMSSEDARRYDMEFFGNMVANKDIQRSIGNYLEKLGGAKKKQ